MNLLCFTRSPARHWLQLATAAMLVAGCGGGGDAPTSPSSASTTATSYAAGAIGGFGSVIVNGVRFDDSKAQVSDDDGSPATSSALRLGMRVEIQGGAVSDDGTGPRATANEIRFGSELLGPVSAIDTTTKSLVVLGQTVLVLDTTVIDDRLVGGFAAIAVGQRARGARHTRCDHRRDHRDANRAERCPRRVQAARPGGRARQHGQDIHDRRCPDLVRRP